MPATGTRVAEPILSEDPPARVGISSPGAQRIPTIALLLPIIALGIFLLPLLVLGLAYRSWLFLGGSAYPEVQRAVLATLHGFFALNGLVALLYAAVTYFLLRFFRAAGTSALPGFQPVSAEAYVFSGLTGALLAGTILIGGGLLSARHASFPTATAHSHYIPVTYPELAAVLPVVALLVPVAEEMYFRGLLLAWLGERLSFPAAAILSALAFSLTHFRLFGYGDWLSLVALTVLGLSNAAWVAHSKSLRAAIVAHAIYNAALTGFQFWRYWAL